MYPKNTFLNSKHISQSAPIAKPPIPHNTQTHIHSPPPGKRLIAREWHIKAAWTRTDFEFADWEHKGDEKTNLTQYIHISVYKNRSLWLNFSYATYCCHCQNQWFFINCEDPYIHIWWGFPISNYHAEIPNIKEK